MSTLRLPTSLNAAGVIGLTVGFVMHLASSVCIGQIDDKGKTESKEQVKAEEQPLDLAQRLMRKAVTETDESLMEGIVRMMSDAAKKLEIHFDAGEETQKLQAEISAKIDEAIKIAAAKRKPLKQEGAAAAGDKRRMPSKPSAGRAPKPGATRGDQSGVENAQTDMPGAAARESRPSDFLEPRRAWGNLPQREREELIQGSTEESIERYRRWIEEYYRILQGSNE